MSLFVTLFLLYILGARNNPINDTQLLIFEFTVHVYGYDLSIQGNSYSLTATFTVDGNVEGTGQYSVSINGAQTSLVWRENDSN